MKTPNPGGEFGALDGGVSAGRSGHAIPRLRDLRVCAGGGITFSGCSHHWASSAPDHHGTAPSSPNLHC